MTEEDKYLVQTRSQAKPSGVKVPVVHGIEKGLVLHVKPGRLKSVKLPTDKRLPIPKPRIGQGLSESGEKQGLFCPHKCPYKHLPQM